ncbi:MAG: hypothetical protein ND895_23320 [Pyrinomonadaceae bacterium]|nr:hypothetical protein [Pyrinomonadaceae bacterium]
MKSRIIPGLLALLVLAPSSFGQSLEQVFINEDRFGYNGYTITRSLERSAKTASFIDSRIIVRRGNKTLATIEGCCYRESTRFALIPLLGNGRKQLVVEAYSGGAHCCTSYHIYDLAARFRSIFDGGKYDFDQVGYEMELVDINSDGAYEFVQRVMNFDYFNGSHAGSIFPEVVFAYDRRAGEFRPGNRAFASYVLRDIGKKEQLVSTLNADVSSLGRISSGDAKTLADSRFRADYYKAVADVLLTYVFAGRREEGWSYFDKNYRLRDKGTLRAGLREVLASSTVYGSIYPR